MSETPVDVAAVQADDALLDMLGAGHVALRWAAGRIEAATGKIPQCSEEREPLCFEYWRGYRDAAAETAQLLRDLAEGGFKANDDLARVLVAWRRDVDTEPIPVLIADGYQLPFLVRMRVAIRGFFGLGGE